MIRNKCVCGGRGGTGSVSLLKDRRHYQLGIYVAMVTLVSAKLNIIKKLNKE